jgi:hypothetical protein
MDLSQEFHRVSINKVPEPRNPESGALGRHWSVVPYKNSSNNNNNNNNNNKYPEVGKNMKTPIKGKEILLCFCFYNITNPLFSQERIWLPRYLRYSLCHGPSHYEQCGTWPLISETTRLHD